MTARVVGLDLSLTATGVAWIEDDQVHTCTIGSKPAGALLADRNARLLNLESRIAEPRINAALVVVEAPSLHSKGAGTWDRAGLWWYVVRACSAQQVPVAEVPPATVKKFATGRGNADKSAVAVGMSRLWPDVEAGNDNEWDALVLATIGAQKLGMPVPSRAHHADALAKVAWPDGLVQVGSSVERAS